MDRQTDTHTRTHTDDRNTYSTSTCIQRRESNQARVRGNLIFLQFTKTAVSFINNYVSPIMFKNIHQRESLNRRSPIHNVTDVRFKIQEAQLSQRDRAMLYVTEYFSKSLKSTQDHSK